MTNPIIPTEALPFVVVVTRNDGFVEMQLACDDYADAMRFAATKTRDGASVEILSYNGEGLNYSVGRYLV